MIPEKKFRAQILEIEEYHVVFLATIIIQM